MCKEADNLLNSLNVVNEWNILQKHCVGACLNCGNPDHGIPKCKCPKLIGQNQIDKAKAKFPKNGDSCGGRGGRSGGGHSPGQGHGNDGNQTNFRGKWKGNDSVLPHERRVTASKCEIKMKSMFG